jgi:hypothetical protein
MMCSPLRLAGPLLGAAPLVVASACLAQWTADTATNTPVVDRAGSQVTPKFAARADGGSYVVWFDNAFGGYRVYMQRLDAAGHEMWPHNGILVSAQPQDTSLVDWDLIADSAGNAVVTFCDLRGGDMDVWAYRVAADGSMMWGADGIAISENPDYEAAPRVCENSQGDFVFVWPQIPSTGTGSIRMQRVTPAGVPQLPANGVKIGGLANEKPAFSSVVAAENGAVIVSWVRNIAQFTSPRHLHTQKVAPDGTLLWNGGTGQIVVHDQPLPIAYTPRLLPDGAGGAWYVWHRAVPTLYTCYVQHLNAAGAAQLTANGFEVSLEAGVHKIDPAAALDPVTGSLWVFFGKRDAAQSNRGLQGQRITSEGVRAWGANGLELRPVDLVAEEFARVQTVGTDAIVTWFEYPTFGGMASRILAQRMDPAGNAVWSGGAVAVCSTLSSKDKPAIARGNGDGVLLCWSDQRSGNDDIYAQRLNPDGTPGNPAGNPADFNGDGLVNGADLGSLLAVWGSCGGCPQDLDGDGVVGGADLGALLAVWTP